VALSPGAPPEAGGVDSPSAGAFDPDAPLGGHRRAPARDPRASLVPLSCAPAGTGTAPRLAWCLPAVVLGADGEGGDGGARGRRWAEALLDDVGCDASASTTGCTTSHPLISRYCRLLLLCHNLLGACVICLTVHLRLPRCL
jgi:hypothetical protein